MIQVIKEFTGTDGKKRVVGYKDTEEDKFIFGLCYAKDFRKETDSNFIDNS